MNRYFVSIKVDREERPDVDRIYMAALQAMTQRGGWPLSMFLTPDLKPFYGATYIPPAQFKDTLTRIHEIWTTDPERITRSGEQLTQFLKLGATGDSGRSTNLDKLILSRALDQLSQDYDNQYAGFGSGPKFPRPSTFNFLLRFYHRFNDEQALRMTLSTLRKMAEGGIYDHLGGGFHRYSVDRQWRVPHFEKMLYDQAQLVPAYLDAYKITKDELYASIARETIGYVLGRMTDEGGAFYSAEDAESAVDPAKPREKQEGAFYVWSKKEIERALGEEQARLFAYKYGIVEPGNVSEDPHKTFVGRNILYSAHTDTEVAARFKKSPEEVKEMLSESRAKLAAERERRPRPILDDKVLVSWNGLMISALAQASQVLGDASYVRAAERAADFVLRELFDSKSGRLLRRYRDGEARYEANLEDYAFLVTGLLDLYEADSEVRWLKYAVRLTEQQIGLFFDKENGGFFDTSGTDKTLLFRTKDDYDAAEPAGNSVAILNLLRLSQMTDNPEWRAIAERTLTFFAVRLNDAPSALPQMLAALDFHLDKPKQIIIAGKRGRTDTERMLNEVYRRYIPNRVILLADGEAGQEFLSRQIPFLSEVRMIANKATAYICENYVCQLPTSDLDTMGSLLDRRE